jgi:phenylpyruvate tautomerase PptA (4-oxalocrotonate tautomerase family)
MPLWKIYHPVGAFTGEDKHALSKRITEIYSSVLPKFYVGVIFQEIAADSFYIGGEPTKNFVRIYADHIARTLSSDEARARFLAKVDAAVAPFIKDRGFDWEFHVDETPFDLWTIQGFRPPRPGTDDEKRWIAENKASPRTHA